MNDRIIDRCRHILAFVAFAAALTGSSLQARTTDIALTFDDLPALSLIRDEAYMTALNRTLVHGLKRHHMPATGFVIGRDLTGPDSARQIAILKLWLDAGMDLGNHSYSHESPNMLGASGYIADIARAEPVLKALLEARHKTLRWYRHPYLETGHPESVKRTIDDWIAAHGYRIAPVTVDANDWQFAEPYDDAIARHDEARRLQIKTEYLRYTETMLRWSMQAARQLFGRGISHVMLLHATRLNADSIDDLAALFRRNRLHCVSLDSATRDPAYRTADTYAGPDGIEWLERWSQTLHKDLPWASFKETPQDIQADYARVDKDP